MEREKGTVKFFHQGKGFGFITRDSDKQDFFIGIRDIEADGTFPKEGEKVEFSIGQNAKGPKAVDVKILNLKGV